MLVGKTVHIKGNSRAIHLKWHSILWNTVNLFLVLVSCQNIIL